MSCDRETLYQEVWAEPVTKVAARYRVSDVALAKTCRKLGVPLPGRGYWARLRAGRPDPIPPLPPPRAGQTDSAVIHPTEQPEPPAWFAALEQARPIELTQPIGVSNTLEDPHRLVALSARYLAKARPQAGLLVVSRRSCLDISVSPPSLDRALRIFDALIKALTEAGITTEIAPVDHADAGREGQRRLPTTLPQPPRRVTRVVYEGESIEFSLTESVRRLQAPAQDAPPETRAGRATFTYEPTGKLNLQLTNAGGLGVRTRWQDGKGKRLEELLGDFVSNLSKVALAFKLQRQAAEEQARAQAEAQRRRLEELRRQEEEEEEERRRQEGRRGEQLEDEVSQWKQAQDIRSYVRAALGLGREEVIRANLLESIPEHLRWALAYADRIDPLCADRDD